MIKIGERDALPYKGDHGPVEINAGSSKAAGWKWAEQAGAGSAALDGTYNDTAAVTVYGESSLQAPDYRYDRQESEGNAIAIADSAPQPIKGLKVFGASGLAAPAVNCGEHSGRGTLEIGNTLEGELTGIRIQGKTAFKENNLSLTKGSITKYGVTVTVEEGNVVTVNGTTTSAWAWFKLTNGLDANTGTPGYASPWRLEDCGLENKVYSVKRHVIRGEATDEGGNAPKYTLPSVRGFLKDAQNIYEEDKLSENGAQISNGAQIAAICIYVGDVNVRHDNVSFAINLEEGSTATSTADYIASCSVSNPCVTVSAEDPAQWDSITLPVVLRSNGAVCDQVDTYSKTLTRRIGEDGRVLAAPVVTNFGDTGHPLQSYEGRTRVTVTEDHGLEPDFFVLAAQAGAPEKPSPLNPFQIASLENPTVTASTKNLFNAQAMAGYSEFTGITEFNGKPCFQYRDGSVNFTTEGYISFKPDTVYTLAIKCYRDPEYADTHTDLVFVYTDGTTSAMRAMIPGTDYRIRSTAGKTVKAITGNWSYGKMVYVDLSYTQLVEGFYLTADLPPVALCQTQSITLPYTLRGIKDNTGKWVYRDYIDVARKVLVRQCAEVTLSRFFGATSVNDQSQAAASGYRLTSDNCRGNANKADIVSIAKQYLVSNFDLGYGGFGAGTTYGWYDGHVYINVPKTFLGYQATDRTTAENRPDMDARAIAWAKANPPTVLYPLAEPVETPLPELEELFAPGGAATLTITDDNGLETEFSALVPTRGAPPAVSPENPFSIVSVENPVVRVEGKNLFDVSKLYSVNGFARTKTGFQMDGTVYNLHQSLNNCLNLKPGGTYTAYREFSQYFTGVGGAIWLEKANGARFTAVDYRGGPRVGTFTVPEDSPITRILIFGNGWPDHTTGPYPSEISNIMFLEGAHSLQDIGPYVPYQEPQSVTLPYTLYGIKDNTGAWRCRDYIDFDRKVLVRQCWEMILDGRREYWSEYYNDYNAQTVMCLLGYADNGKYAMRHGSPSYISHLPWIDWFQRPQSGSFVTTTYGGNGRYEWFMDKTLLGITDDMTKDQKSQAFKAWLDRNRPTVVYQLATPIEIPLPELERLPSFYPYTRISCTDGAGNPVDITLRAKVPDRR